MSSLPSLLFPNIIPQKLKRFLEELQSKNSIPSSRRKVTVPNDRSAMTEAVENKLNKHRSAMESITSFIPPQIHAKNLGENERAATSK